MNDLTEPTAIEKEMAELAKEPEIEIVLTDDKNDGGKADTEDPREALAQLRRELSEQRQQADQERQARIQWQQRAHHSDYVAVANAAENAERQYATLADKLRDALERADATEAANIQLKMTEMSRHVQDLRDAVERTKNPPPAPADPRAQQDAWLAQQSPANASWIREHRDRFFNDPQFSQKAVAASQYASHVLGLEVGSREYFDHIDQAVGVGKNGNASGAQRTESRRSSSPTIAAAPPSRYVPGTNQTNTSRITLSREQRDHARFLYPDAKDPDTQYAHRILADYRAGLCDANGKYFQR